LFPAHGRLAQHRHGDIAFGVAIASAEDGLHPPFAEFFADAVFFRGSGWKVGKGLGGIGNGLLGGLARGVELEKPLGALDFWRGILRWRIVGNGSRDL
jgi:hypothetical protein